LRILAGVKAEGFSIGARGRRRRRERRLRRGSRCSRKALSDGANALRLSLLSGFWEKLKAIHAVVA